MTLEKQLGSILKKLKNTVANIIEIESTVNSRAESVNATNEDVQAKAEEMKKYVDTMNSSINTLNTLETQISDLKTSVSSTTDRAEKMLKETQAIRDTLTDALVWKGSVENYAALPTTNVRVGDTYNVTAADSAHNINAGDNVVWDGTKWDSMGGIMNVDSLAVKGQDANFKEVTATTFHGTLNGKADSATTADVAKTVAWSNIGGKPATFPSDIKFDDVPTVGSSNAVKSSGIKSALDQKLSTFGGTLTGDITLSGDVAIGGKGGALINSSETAIGLAAINTVDFYGKKGSSIERTSYIDTTNGKYHGDVIGTADRATIAVNDGSGRSIVDTYLQNCIELGSVDLDTLKAGGLYTASNNDLATAERHYPEPGYGGSLMVVGNTHGSSQTYTTYFDGSRYTRTYIAEYDAWSEWYRLSYMYDLDNKQDKLTFDTTPTENSTNPVTSDGIKKAIDISSADNVQYEKLNGHAENSIIKAGKIVPPSEKLQFIPPTPGIVFEERDSNIKYGSVDIRALGEGNGKISFSFYEQGGPQLSSYTLDESGNFSGNAATATKATQDASGNVITDIYATKTQVNTAITNAISAITDGDNKSY